jgi:hypothetical protein
MSWGMESIQSLHSLRQMDGTLQPCAPHIMPIVQSISRVLFLLFAGVLIVIRRESGVSSVTAPMDLDHSHIPSACCMMRLVSGNVQDEYIISYNFILLIPCVDVIPLLDLLYAT